MKIYSSADTEGIAGFNRWDAVMKNLADDNEIGKSVPPEEIYGAYQLPEDVRFKCVILMGRAITILPPGQCENISKFTGLLKLTSKPDNSHRYQLVFYPVGQVS